MVQPVTGLALWLMEGFPPSSPWLLATPALFASVGTCWLLVAWLQSQLHRIGEASCAPGESLLPLFRRYARTWFIPEWPAFAAVMAIVWLMIAKPALRLLPIIYVDKNAMPS